VALRAAGRRRAGPRSLPTPAASTDAKCVYKRCAPGAGSGMSSSRACRSAPADAALSADPNSRMSFSPLLPATTLRLAGVRVLLGGHRGRRHSRFGLFGLRVLYHRFKQYKRLHRRLLRLLGSPAK
jgi:hypothetical protein